MLRGDCRGVQLRSRALTYVALLMSLVTLTAPPYPVASAAEPLTEPEPAPLGSVAGDDSLLSSSDSSVPVGDPTPVHGSLHTIESVASGPDNPTVSTVNNPSEDDSESAPIPGRYIVRVARGRSPSVIARELGSRGFDAELLSTNSIRTVLVDLDPSDPDELRELAGADGVAQVWQDQTVTLSTNQSNPPWGLDRLDQESLPLDSNYSYDTDGTGVTAYIVDTGTRGTHQDFGGRVTSGWSGTGEPGNGDTDCHGHGTHVAGTVAGATYGVAKNATIVPIRVLSCSGSGAFSTVIAGVDWAIADHQSGVPAVMNLSLGGSRYDPVDAAMAAAVADGIVVVVAAGNSNADACGSSPARAPLAITVGATDSIDAKASFSNFGPCLDIWAPGVNISSAYRTSDTAAVMMSGTSMAAPHVAGAVARLLDANPSLSVEQVTRIITGNTVLVDERNILQSPLYADDTTPAAPTGLVATPRNGAATIQWTAPGSGVDSTVIDLSTGGSSALPRRTTRLDVFDLTNGQSVTVSARGLNSTGYGPSSSVIVTPLDDGSPDRPTIGRVGPGNRWLNVEVNFPAVPSGGAISAVTVTAVPASGSTVTKSVSVEAGSTQKLVKVEGLTNLTTYTISATASNGSGEGAPSSTVTASPLTSTTTSGAWTSTHMAYPSAARAPIVVDESRNLVWAGGVSRGLVAIDVDTRLAASGSLPSGSGMWMFLHEATNRVFAVPHQGGGFVYELSVSGSTVTATAVATTGVATYAAHLDQSTNELLLVGSSLKRYSIGSSGTLSALSVPSMSFGGEVGTSLAVNGAKVAIGSNLGGWVKLWDRTTNSVSEATGMTRVGTLHAMESGVLVTPTQASTVHKLSWTGTTLSTLDLQLPVYAGGTFNGHSYTHRYADVVDASNDTVVILHESQLVSLDTSTMTVVASGSGFDDEGSLTQNETGNLLGSAWVADVDGALRSRWKDFAVGSFELGNLLNAARRIVSGTRFGGIYVASSSGTAVRVVERASSPLEVVVESANGAARVTWQQPARITDSIDDDTDAEYQLRPVTYDVVLQPGNITHEWRGGPLDMVIAGLDPDVTYTAVVRAKSPGGVADSEPETFTPSTSASRPATPTGVGVAQSGEGCITVSWNSVSGASNGFRIELSGRSETTTASADSTSEQICGLVTTNGVFPRVSARVTALSSAESIPSPWTAGLIPSALPVFEGSVYTTAVSETLGIAVATTFSVTAAESSARRTALVVTDDTGVRSRPLPVNTPVIVGIDDFRREVFVARCNVVNGGIMALSLDDLSRSREVLLPTTNQWDFCRAAFDPVMRALWLAPTIYSNDDNYDTDGTDVVAVSVDTDRRIVASSNLTCQPGSWSGSVYIVGYPHFTVDNGETFASCMSRSTSGNKPEYAVVTNAATGDVVRTSTTWLAPVGSTADGYPITITDADVTIHSPTPSVVSFGTLLGYDAATLGRPWREGETGEAKIYRRSGHQVTVIPSSSGTAPYVVDTSAGTSRRVLATGAGRNGGTILAAGEAVVALADDSVYSTITSSAATRATPSTISSYPNLPRGGQRVGAWGYSYTPTHLYWMGDDTMVSLAKLRVPDNLGTPTDEIYHSAFWSIAPPARPTVTGRSSGTLAWSNPPHSPGIAAGTTARWVMNLPGSSAIVRDSAGTIRCTTASTTCSAASAFGEGATVEARTFSSVTDRMLVSAVASDGITAPVAPRLVPRPPESPGELSVHVGMLDATASSWELMCSSRGTSLTRTGSTPTLVTFDAPFGLWSCRVRGLNSGRAGDWSSAVTAESRDTNALGSAVSTASGSIVVGSGPFTCRTSAGTVTGQAGQTLVSTSGQWPCAVVLPDQTSVGVLAHVHETPTAPTSLSVTRSGSNAVLSFVLAPAVLVADTSAAIECTGALTYSGSAVRTTVDLGQFGVGSTTCTVTRNFLVPGSSTIQTTSSTSTTFMFSRPFRVQVTGSGTVTSAAVGISCTDDCSTGIGDAATVTLTASPASGWQVASWSESSCGSSTTCTVDATTVGTVTATFTEVATTTAPTTTTVPTTTTTVPTTTSPSTTSPPATTVAPFVTTPSSTATTTPKSTTKTLSRSSRTNLTRLTSTAVARSVKVTVAKGSSTTLVAQSSTKRVCTTSKSVLRFLRDGTCRATLTVTSGKSKTIVSVTIIRKAGR